MTGKNNIREEVTIQTTLYVRGDTYKTFQEYARRNHYRMTDLFREALLEYGHTLDRRMKDRGKDNAQPSGR